MIAVGAKVLKAVSAVAAALWILAVVFDLLELVRHRREDSGSISFTLSAGSGTNSSVLQALATTLGSTWGYLLVAVLAYTGSMLLHGQRMRLLVAAMSDDD